MHLEIISYKIYFEMKLLTVAIGCLLIHLGVTINMEMHDKEQQAPPVKRKHKFTTRLNEHETVDPFNKID